MQCVLPTNRMPLLLRATEATMPAKFHRLNAVWKQFSASIQPSTASSGLSSAVDNGWFSRCLTMSKYTLVHSAGQKTDMDAYGFVSAHVDSLPAREHAAAPAKLEVELDDDDDDDDGALANKNHMKTQPSDAPISACESLSTISVCATRLLAADSRARVLAQKFGRNHKARRGTCLLRIKNKIRAASDRAGQARGKTRSLFRDALKGLLVQNDPTVRPNAALLKDKFVLGGGAPPLAWQVVTDRVFGGSSQGGFDAATGIFSGHVAQPGGFVAIRAPLSRELGDIEGFAGLAARVRSDGGKYTLSVKPVSSFKDDLYQSFLVVGTKQWIEVELGFADMLLTGSGGGVREAQRALDAGPLTHVVLSCGGINAAPGPFALQLDWLKWIRGATKRKPRDADVEDDE